jgi:chromosome segregation ATPase
LTKDVAQTQADQVDLADAMQREIATVAAECNQTAGKLSALQTQANKTSVELTQIGDKVVGELQERFDVLEVQIAESVPSLDAKIRRTSDELLKQIDWKIDAGLAEVEQDNTLYRASNTAAPAVLERHEHALSSLEDMAIDVTTRLDAIAGHNSELLASVEGGSSRASSGVSTSAVAALRDDVAQGRAESTKASKRSKQAERSIGTLQDQLRGVTAQVNAVQSTVAAMRQQNDASTAGVVSRIETI